MVHVGTTAIMCGLSVIPATALWVPVPKIPVFLWYAATWPHTSLLWSLMLAGAAAMGLLGVLVMAGAFKRNKYLILLASTCIAAGHAYIAQTIWTSYHFGTGTVTCPCICAGACWVFWRTYEGHVT